MEKWPLLVLWCVVVVVVTAKVVECTADSTSHQGADGKDSNLRWKAKAGPSYEGGSDQVSYVAAVVEYGPVYSLRQVNRAEALKIMIKNLDGYERAIQEAKNRNKNVQIMVFPEDGLYGAYFPDRDWAFPYTEFIPDVFNGSPYINPCTSSAFNDTSVLKRVSCLAREYGVVIVLDMADYQPCDSNTDKNCPADGHYQYNTQVAVSEVGQLLAKYHKSHLYFEPEWNEGPQKAVYFDASFGVRFGMFICFDIMFPQPQTDLLQKYGVKDIAYSTWWVNFPPYITATQTQQAWSRLNQVNILAADSGTSWYNSGSGIYSNGNALQSFYNPTGNSESKVLISSVTTTRSKPLSSPHHTTTPTTTTATTTSLVAAAAAEPYNILVSPQLHSQLIEGTNWVVKPFEAVPGLSTTMTVTAGSLKCEATFKVSSSKKRGLGGNFDTYGLVALNGMYNGLFVVQACGLMLCPGTVSNPSCTNYSMAGTTLFDEFSIQATFAQNIRQLAMVASNNATLLPITKYDAPLDGGRMASTEDFHAESMINACIFGLVW